MSVQCLKAVSSTARESCLCKCSAPVHTYVTRVIWVQAGWDGRGQAGSTCLWRDTFRQLRASAHHPRGWSGLVLPTTHTKKNWGWQKLPAQSSPLWLSCVMLGWVLPYVHAARPQDSRACVTEVNMTVWFVDGARGSVVLTIVWDGACICKWKQHIQHGYSIRELVKAVDVLVDGAQQLTYHPVWRQVRCCRGKSLEGNYSWYSTL